MKISRRELVLALITGAAILFGVTFLLAGPRIAHWRELRARQKEVAQEIIRAKKLVAKRGYWESLVAEYSGMLPRVQASKKMDVHWLSIMDKLATKHDVQINQRAAGQEKDEGEVFELPIDCKEWEGSLEGIVRFLYDLQTEGAMFDIRHLFIKPKGKGVLRGRFSLYCAYTRESAEDDES